MLAAALQFHNLCPAIQYLLLHFLRASTLQHSALRCLLQLAVATILFSFGLSVYLYATSFAKGALLAEGGNSGAWTCVT